MPARIGAAAATLLAATLLAAADDDRRLMVVPSKSLPAIEAVSVYKAGAKKDKPLVSVSKFADPAVLPGEGPFDVYVKPKGGIEVLAVGKLTVKPGQTHELKLGELLGTLDVFPKDDFPKVGKLVATAPDDPGPDEKGHVAVQTAGDFRDEMPVPEGFYAVWLVPTNGARATRIADRVRVLPGRSTRVGE